MFRAHAFVFYDGRVISIRGDKLEERGMHGGVTVPVKTWVRFRYFFYDT